jgi:hypothetical protein
MSMPGKDKPRKTDPNRGPQTAPDDDLEKMSSEDSEAFYDACERLAKAAIAGLRAVKRSDAADVRAAMLDAVEDIGLISFAPKRERRKHLKVWAAKNSPQKACDLLALAVRRRAQSVEFTLKHHGPASDREPYAWMRESDALPTWARADDDVEPLDYGVDIGPDMVAGEYGEGGDGWMITRRGAVVGYCFESDGGLYLQWSEEAPEAYDPRSYDPMP